MTTLSVVIPAFNEESGIEEISNRVLRVRDSLKQVGVEGFELLVVDDGSKDRTAEIAENVDGVRLIRHPKNKGYGAALKTGFNEASGDLVGFLDADGTYPPEYFPALCTKIFEGYDLVIGSRMAGEKTEMPLVRKIGNKFFAGMISLLARQKITDSASGMRVFKKEALEKMGPLPDGLNLTPIMSTRALHENIRMVEVPIPYKERIGRSKLSVVRDGIRYVQTITWTVLLYNPIRVLGLLGLTGFAVAIAVALGLVISRLQGVTTLGPLGVAALFLGMVSAVGGISLFSLGATFNYLVSLFYRRPIRQGLFGKPFFTFPLEKNFGWIGAISLLAGVIMGIVSLVLGVTGWEITRLWFYLVGSALLFLVGLQFIVYDILIRVLAELNAQQNVDS